MGFGQISEAYEIDELPHVIKHGEILGSFQRVDKVLEVGV